MQPRSTNGLARESEVSRSSTTTATSTCESRITGTSPSLSRAEFTKEFIARIYRHSTYRTDFLTVIDPSTREIACTSDLDHQYTHTPQKRKILLRQAMMRPDQRRLPPSTVEPVPTQLMIQDVRINDHIVLQLQLDYEIAPGYTLLLCILDAVCRYDSHHHYLVDGLIEHHDCIGLMTGIVENLTRHGYNRGLQPFSLNCVWLPELATSVKECNDNILTTILGLKQRHIYAHPSTPNRTIDSADTIELAYATWMEKLVTLILEQPSVTKVIKYELVNFYQSASKPRQTILQSVITYSDVYLPIVRILLKHGADVNFSSSGMGVLPPLLQAVEVDNIAVLIEMILSQPNLMEIDLTSDKHRPSLIGGFTHLFPASIIAAVRDHQGMMSDKFASTHYPTPKKLARHIIERLYQWQEDQRTHIGADSNFRSNDASMRDWLHQQLSSLPTLLFSFTMHNQVCELARRPDQSLLQDESTELMKPLIERWILQLAHAPEHIHLTELSSDKKHPTTLLADSIKLGLFFQTSFRPHLPQLLALLDESQLPFIQGLALFLWDRNSYLSVLGAIATQFQVISEIGDVTDRAEQGQVLVKFLALFVSRLNHILEESHSQSDVNMPEHLKQLKLLHGYDLTDHARDAELLDSLMTQFKLIEANLPKTLTKLIQNLAWHGTIEVFRTIWCDILPILATFRSNQTRFLYECLDGVVRSTHGRFGHYGYLSDTTATAAFDRVHSFLSDPLLQTSELFGPFELMPSDATESNGGLNLVFLVMKQMTPYSANPEALNHRTWKKVFDYVIELESKWRKIHWPAIRTNLEVYLIVDLVDVVMNYLQPSASLSRSELSVGLLSPPAQFVLQPTTKPSNLSFAPSTSNVASGSSASVTPTTTAAIAPTNFSLTAFNWPPSTAAATTTATTAALSSNPFVFPSASSSLSSSSNPFLTPISMVDSGTNVVNPFLLSTNCAIEPDE